jgi:tetratricopeptide (TPR) repeat protein
LRETFHDTQHRDRLLKEVDPVDSFSDQPSPAQPACSLAAGELIAGRYLITRMIGRGGMGEVYEAQDRMLHENVALKTMRTDLACNDDYIRRFAREIQLARKVTHPNVCRVFEVVYQEGTEGRPPLHFFTMELLSGETLSARIRRVQRLPRGVAFRLAVQMAEGLQAAHDVGIVHTDFKSGNVVVVPGPGGERAVITDFGLARHDPGAAAPDETITMTAAGQVVGTVAYMSPEQLTGGMITPASDIYSFGIVLFEMATGRLPFEERHLINAAVQRVSGNAISARALVTDLDPRWEAAIAKCLQTDPQRRFSSAEDLADWFREGGWRLPRLYWTRRDWVRAGLAAGVPVLAGGGYWIWSRRPYQPNREALFWYGKGVAALRSMTYWTAKNDLEKAVVADPQFALAKASLARAYDELDDSESAAKSLVSAMTAAQETRLSSADARKLRALQPVILHDYDRAVSLFQELENEASEGDRPAAALESGWLAQRRDDTDGAEAAYKRALMLDQNYAAAHLRLAYILGRRRKLDQASAEFEKAAELYSPDLEGVTETLIQRASFLNRSSGHAKEAMQVIEKALPLAQTVGNRYQQINLLLLQGVAARNNNKIEQARALAKEGIEQAVAEKMDTLEASGLIDWGNAFLRGDPDLGSAEEKFRQALGVAERGKFKSLEARASVSLASLMEQSNRPEQAKRWVKERALPFYQEAGYRLELVQSLGVLGGALEQLGEFDEAGRVLSQALDSAVQLQDRPDIEVQVLERLGENLRDLGNWPEALKKFETAWTRSESKSGRALLDCAGVYSRLGRKQDAESALLEVERLLNANPVLLFDLRTTQAEIAYQDGRAADEQHSLSLARAAASGGGEGSEPKVQLIEALVQIRESRNGAAESAGRAIQGLADAKLPLDAAAARLTVAQALLAAGDRARALGFARDGVDFFEQRGIYESMWRAYSIMAGASRESAEAKTYQTQADSALVKLKALWPAQSLEGYLDRSDIKKLLLYTSGKV